MTPGLAHALFISNALLEFECKHVRGKVGVANASTGDIQVTTLVEKHAEGEIYVKLVSNAPAK